MTFAVHRFRFWFALAAILLSSITAYASNSLTACYNAYYIFKVGETCITYTLNDREELEVESFARSAGMVNAVRRFTEESRSVLSLDPMQPKSFYQRQSNRRGSRVHDYIFEGDQVNYTVARFNTDGSLRRIESDTQDLPGVFEPYSLSLFIQLTGEQRGELPLFFGGETGSVEFRERGTSTIEAAGETFRTKRLDIIPKARDEDGALSPEGNWRFWIDKETGLLVQMRISVAVGSATITLSDMSGNKRLLERIKLPPL
ncbi:DUF3108 domain-containing protein [Desulfurispira natronophila]|uniref:DUF3108 domain-containing protein n=1 Tax=Desulfurispira natronophila TaxID=682562 RepID=A0A7W7Y4M6_9BACT|nr:DUF3108 domain-containing protein [Desulfurispira natronophila]MBB5021983.1 hypothetical protein [Desulfurispira natronophila]